MSWNPRGAALILLSPKTGNTYPLDTGLYGGNTGYGARGPAAGGYDVNPYNGAPMTPAAVSMKAHLKDIHTHGALGRSNPR